MAHGCPECKPLLIATWDATDAYRTAEAVAAAAKVAANAANAAFDSHCATHREDNRRNDETMTEDRTEDSREKIVGLTMQLLKLCKEKYRIIPRDVFVYGLGEDKNVDYRTLDFFGHDAEEPGAAFFAALRCLYSLDRVGGWSFEFITPPNWASLEGLRGARGFVGFENGDLTIQIYGMADDKLKPIIRKSLAKAFGTSGVALGVYT